MIRHHPTGGLTSLWDMLSVNASSFYLAVSGLRHAQAITKGWTDKQRAEPMEDEHRKQSREALEKLLIELVTLGARVTFVGAETLMKRLDRDTFSYEEFIVDFEHVNRTLRDELSLIKLFCLPNDKEKLFDSKGPLFGAEVDAAFPTAKEDIEEAGKCLALVRNTAAVFHLSRAMEAAVQALSAKLGMSNLDREWGKLLSEMKGKIEAMPLGNVRNQWSENHSLLYHVKQAWRNDVMHPKATYTEEQALEVFQAMRSFMRNLAPLVS